MGLFRWLRYLLFPPAAPSRPPENRETRALWREAKSLAAIAPLSLYPGDWARTTVERLGSVWGVEAAGELSQALIRLAEQLLLASGLYNFPSEAALDYALADLERGAWLREELRQKILLLRQPKHYEALLDEMIPDLLMSCLEAIDAPPSNRSRDGAFRVPLLSCIADIGEAIQTLMGRFYREDVLQTPLFLPLRQQLAANLEAVLPKASPVTPAEYIRQKKIDPVEALELFLQGTPLLDVFAASLPFAIPEAVRFEHLHIVAGSGHGKTQTLQHLLLADLARAERERFGFALIDSQGDLINQLIRLQCFDPDEGALAGRLILIDPADLKHPAGLNLFDYNLDRFQHFAEVEREKVFHGVIELYTYMFSSLLGAELTQKQGVVFTNLARALLILPHPTVYTFYDFVEDGTKFKPYLEQLDGIPRRFFDTQFFTNTYSETRKQIITRLLGVLGNPAFERMFAHPRNNVDMFGAMQDGKIVVVNTAKDLLKSEGSALLGRFFIALTTQATIARAALPERERTPYHVYIDEAQEYVDYKTDELLNQGRKFRVGVTLAHQHLNQLSMELRATLKASTSTKLVGGVNHADAVAFAQEMQCAPDYIQGMRKREAAGYTEFACYVRHHTPHPVKLAVPFGALEQRPRLSATAFQQLIEQNRARVAKRPALSAPDTVAAATVSPTDDAAESSVASVSRSGSSRKKELPRPADGPITPKDDLDFYIQ